MVVHPSYEHFPVWAGLTAVGSDWIVLEPTVPGSEVHISLVW